MKEEQTTWEEEFDNLFKCKLYEFIRGEIGSHDVKEDFKSFIDPLLKKEREKAIEEMLDRLKGCVNSTYDSYKNIEAFLTSDEIVECQTCRTLKISSPTPEGDDTCPSCGDVEMLDYEFTPHRPTYSESKLKK